MSKSPEESRRLTRSDRAIVLQHWRLYDQDWMAADIRKSMARHQAEWGDLFEEAGYPEQVIEEFGAIFDTYATSRRKPKELGAMVMSLLVTFIGRFLRLDECYKKEDDAEGKPEHLIHSDLFFLTGFMLGTVCPSFSGEQREQWVKAALYALLSGRAPGEAPTLLESGTVAHWARRFDDHLLDRLAAMLADMRRASRDL